MNQDSVIELKRPESFIDGRSTAEDGVRYQ